MSDLDKRRRHRTAHAEMFWERDPEETDAICLTIGEWRMVVDALREVSGEEHVYPLDKDKMQGLAERIGWTLAYDEDKP